MTTPTCGKEWEELPANERPTFWMTGKRFRVDQLIFKTNNDAVEYVQRNMPERLNEALNAWSD